MKRNVLIIGAVFILLASACAPQATPTTNPADVQGTAQAAAFTMVAETQQALPTATVPPTVTPTVPPTNTPPPLPTLSTQGTQETPAAGATVAVPTGLPTLTSQPQQSSSSSTNNQDICNQPLTSWQGPTANFSIANQTKPQGTIVLSMYVVTEFNQCGYLNITGDSFTGPIGQYSAAAFITGKQNLKAFGSFRITEGNWKVVVRNDSILAQGGCSPNC
ncbi:MAG TPA: hypothetical protein VK897_09400 [Anaerolineales bacterium]|nr:hypothetical protein [Anaerolineales bacterium]